MVIYRVLDAGWRTIRGGVHGAGLDPLLEVLAPVLMAMALWCVIFFGLRAL